MRRYRISFLLFALFWIGLGFALKAITLDVGELPVDYRTYAEATDRLEATGSPYAGAASAQDTWRAMHNATVAMFRPDESADGSTDVISGPYLYPPSLALALSQTSLSASGYLILLTVAAIALGAGWLKLSDAQSPPWLLAMVGSIDLIASFLGGNIEIILIAISLGACWLIWRHALFWAALLVAAVLLVKPQFLLLFLAFGALWLVAAPSPRPAPMKVLGMILLIGALLALEVWRWPETTRADFLTYLSNPADLQYFALPPESQWPMDIWNRAPVQVLLHHGLTFEQAQGAAMTLYLAFLLASVLLLRRAGITFAAAFSLAYVLFLIGRPITWSLPMLALFTLTATWPQLSRRVRVIAGSVAFAIGVTHWIAFALFASGTWPGLLTLQVPGVPWETLLVLPSAWAILVFSTRRQRGSAADRTDN